MVWFNHGIKSYYEFIAYQESRWALAILASAAIHVQCTFRARGWNGAAETRTQSSTESSSDSNFRVGRTRTLGSGNLRVNFRPGHSRLAMLYSIHGCRLCTLSTTLSIFKKIYHGPNIGLTIQWFGTLEKGQPLSFTTKIYQYVTIEIAHYAGMGCACSCTEGLNWLLVC
jgi:hypothetical protein